MTGKCTLIGFEMCPYVHRTLIVLQLTKTDYDVKYIDLKDKPGWFLKLSPTGKVPVLQVGNTVLFESSAINEYLNQATNSSLMPTDPLTQAKHRAWTEYGSGLIMTNARLLAEQDEEAAKQLLNKFQADLGHLDQELEQGPYFSGDSFKLIDAAYAPFAAQLAVARKHFPLAEDIIRQVPKVKAWFESLANYDTVKQVLPADFDQKLVERYKSANGYWYQL